MPASSATDANILWLLGLSAAIFLVVLALAFAAERIFRSPPPAMSPRPFGAALVKWLLAATVCSTAATLALNFAAEKLSTALGLDLPKQDLVILLQNGSLAPFTRAVIIAFALFEAPLLEEAIFRRYLYRNLLRANSLVPWGAMVISGAAFSCVHFNTVTFVPLWFFGSVLAWIYQRTGRLAAPMATHFIFNAVNLGLLFLFPDI